MEKTKLTVQDYASECDVTRATIYNRIDSGEIIPEMYKGVYIIDIGKFPPKYRQKPGRKSKSY